MPLADQRAQLVGCEVEAVEVGQAVLALDLVDSQLDLAERVVLILLEIGQRDLNDASLEGIVGVLQTGGTVDQSLADTATLLVKSVPPNRLRRRRFRGVRFACRRCAEDSLSDVERVRSLDRVPVLAGEGVDGLLLDTLLAL